MFSFRGGAFLLKPFEKTSFPCTVLVDIFKHLLRTAALGKSCVVDTRSYTLGIKKINGCSKHLH